MMAFQAARLGWGTIELPPVIDLPPIIDQPPDRPPVIDPPPPAGEPFAIPPEPILADIMVASDSDFLAALARVLPGQRIVLADGDYSAPTIERSGNRDNPIQIVAANPHQACTTGAWKISGNHILIYQLQWKGGRRLLEVEGNGVKIWRCKFHDCKSTARPGRLLILKGSRFSILCNEFKNCDGSCVYTNPSHGGINGNVERNYFTKCESLEGKSALIAFGGSGDDIFGISSIDNSNIIKSNNIAQYNLIENCASGKQNAPAGEFVNRELVMMKSSHNTFLCNSVVDSRGFMNVRYGSDCWIEGNWLENCFGFFCHGKSIMIKLNRFINIQREIAIKSGSARFEDLVGIKKELIDTGSWQKGKWAHAACENVTISGNICDNKQIEIGPKNVDEDTVKVKDIKILGQPRSSWKKDDFCDDNELTIDENAQIDGQSAKKLTPGDVGVDYLL